MKTLSKFAQMVGIGLGLWALTGCGFLQTDGTRGQKNLSNVLTKARQEAQKLASNRPTIHQGMNLYNSCELVTAELNESLRQRWIQQKADMSDAIGYALNPRSMEMDPQGQQDSIAVPSAASEASTGAADSASNKSSEGADTLTNVQEIGVDEADRFRVGRDQIYALSFNQVKVVERGSLQLQGSLDVSDWYSPQMYTRDDRLIIVGQTRYSASEQEELAQNSTPTSDQVSRPSTGGWGMGLYVQVAVYRTAPGQMPVLLTQSKVKGSYIDSRLVQNNMVLVLKDQIKTETTPITYEDFADEEWQMDKKSRQIFASYYQNAVRESQIKVENESINGIPCSQILNRKVSDWDFSLSKVLSVDIQNTQSPVKSIGIIGQGDKIYMTSDSLYLLKYQINWFDARWGGIAWYGSADEKLLIQQIGFDATTGALNPLAEGEVRGRIKDRWALRGMNGGKNLVIATSTGQLWANEGDAVAQNHLFILEQDVGSKRLNQVGSVENYGTREDIRSVRYVGSTAYVVTFRTVDPLFAFDIKDPKAPKLLSGLKVPGFSTYMHPLASGRLLGVGFDAVNGGAASMIQGIQVSLFDTTDPTAMSRIDNKIYGSRGSNSEVTVDHRAFFHDTTSQLIGLPLVELYGQNGNGVSNLKFSGAQILALENNLLVEKGRVSHREWIPLYCQQQMSYGGYQSFDINRLYRVDDRLLTLSQYGIKAYSLTDFSQPVISLAYQSNPGECSNYYRMSR